MTLLGVGLIGAGSVARGIHVPTLGRLADYFKIVHIADADPVVGAMLAERTGAAFSESFRDLLADEAVQVVAVCSPDGVHAEHVVAACAAGKQAVLCEKPLATSREEATQITEAARISGTHIVVGAMHVYDPAWVDVSPECGSLRHEAAVIRSSIVLPFNDRYEAWSTESSAQSSSTAPLLTTPEQRAARLRKRILALSIHDLPLVRSFSPDWRDVEVSAAGLIDPVGYFVALRCGDRVVQVLGSFRDHWRPHWEFEVLARTSSLTIEFPPSYVHAGSGTAVLREGGRTRSFGDSPRNGYENEWLHLHNLVSRDAAPTTEDLDVIADDLSFAVLVADRAADLVASGS